MNNAENGLQPEFTVIVPVYEVERYLRACADSILAQTFEDFQLILVDDGSPDACPGICDEYAERDPRVLVIHKENGGLADARYAGLSAAAGRYICFVDGDDWVSDDFLRQLKGYIDENGRPDMLLFGLVWDYGTYQEEHPVTAAAGYYDKARLTAEIYPRMLYDRGKPFLRKAIQGHMCAKAAKKELLAAHFANDRRIRVREDDAMAYECLYFADSIYICPGSFYYYRQRADSIMGRYHPDALENTAALYDYMQAHLGRYSPDIALQLNAYMTFWVIRSISDEFRFGHSFGEAARSVRRQMRASRLPSRLRMGGLPPMIGLFVLALKLRLYGLAVLATKARM